MAIVRRNNRYGVKVYVVGEDQRWVGTFDTLREAKRAEREAAVEAAKPKPGVGEEKCEEFAVRFLEEHCHGLERSTIKAYETPVRLFSRDFAGLPERELGAARADDETVFHKEKSEVKAER